MSAAYDPNIDLQVGRGAYRSAARPTPAAMARLIATELDRNEIWD